MRVIVVGLGVQGNKRRNIAGKEVVAIVDPVHPEADYKTLIDVPLNSYDAALVCTPDDAKIELLMYLLDNRKHLLVEKPLLASDTSALKVLANLARTKGVVCYTAYNHRFEPHFIRMKEAIESGELGKVYCARLFYGNGTARLVRDSLWRDQRTGVLPDLGSHLLDTLLFWFGKSDAPFNVYSSNRFENQSFDHFSFGSNGTPVVQLEVTLLNWRNHFYADVLAENGSAHIQSLCKWGPSTFTLRRRQLPSGRPDEASTTLVQSDPTWKLEYQHFKELTVTGISNIENDIWINSVLDGLAHKAMETVA